MLKILSVLLLLASTAQAMETQTYRTPAVTTNRTEVANFDVHPVRYKHFQILNPTAAALECARTPTGDTVLWVPAGFTSITLDDAKPTGRLYCAFVSAAREVVVQIWGLP
jgi:hypothetical protein